MREGCKAIVLAMLLVMLAPSATAIITQNFNLHVGRSITPVFPTPGVGELGSKMVYFDEDYYVTRVHMCSHRSKGSSSTIAGDAYLDGNLVQYGPTHYFKRSSSRSLYCVNYYFPNLRMDAVHFYATRYHSRGLSNVYAEYWPYQFSHTVIGYSIAVLGELGDILQGRTVTTAPTHYIRSDNPQVKVWVGDETQFSRTSTADITEPVFACLDTNFNGQCDLLEDDYDECDIAGGDWYRDECCGGANATVADCEFVTDIKAYCGYTTPTEPEWAPLDEKGNIHELFFCPGLSVTSTGDEFLGCEVTENVTLATNISAELKKTDYAASASQLYVPSCDDDMGRLGWFTESQRTGSGDNEAVVYRYIAACGDGVLGGQITTGTCAADQTLVGSFIDKYKSEYGNVFTTNYNVCIKGRYGGEIQSASGTDTPPACTPGLIDVGTWQDRIETTGTANQQPTVDKTYRLCLSDQLTGLRGFEFENITGYSGSHEYYCTTDYIFECRGDDPQYSAINTYDTGFTSTDIAGQRCPNGLVSHWAFEDDASDSIGINNGSATGVEYVSGKVGKAASFATGDQVLVQHDISLHPPRRFSVEAWINPSDVTGTRAIVHKRSTIYTVVIDGGKLKALVETDGSSPTSFVGTQGINADEWTHIAVTYNSGRLKFYINGVLKETITSITGRIQESTGEFIIGKARGGSPDITEQYVGLIDELAFYNQELDAETIAEHYDDGIPGCESFEVGDVFYCASDSDWTPDIDPKDNSTCIKAGFQYTGSLCCSEADDQNEYYNDFSQPPANFTTAIIESNGVTITDASVVLEDDDDFITIQGPARIREQVQTTIMASGALCTTLPVSTRDILAGREHTITLEEPGTELGGQDCTGRTITVTSQPIISNGGCWDKEYIPTGEFVNEQVVNYHGQFMGCGIANQSLLDLTDYHTDEQLIDNTAQVCGAVLANATQEGGINLVCSPENFWHETPYAATTVAKNISWNPALVQGAHTTGCCPDDKCWNGTACQTLNTYYRVGNAGFVCR